MSSYATAVLCGDLNMLRCFARSNVNTITVCTTARDITLRSRFCRRGALITSPIKDPEETLGDLIQLGKDLNHRAILFYGDDAMLRLVSRNREELSKYFHFLLPSESDIEKMVDKAQFSQWADQLQLPVPQTILSSAVTTADEALARLTPPAVFKPNSHVGWFRSQFILEEGGSPQKAVRADDPAEFRRVFDKLKEHGVDFIMQEYVEGGDDCIYSFHAYFNAQSEPLGYYVGRKIRTYPKGSGLSTYVQLVDDPDVVRVGLDVLKKMNFVGVVKIDFKKDPKRNRLYLLEINPRFNLWNYLGATCGVNLPMLAYRDLTGQPIEKQTTWRTGLRWLSFMDDFRAFVRDYRRDGDISTGGWLGSLLAPKVHDVFSWSDPLPLAIAFTQGAKGYIKKFTRRRKQPVPYIRKGVAK